METQIEQINSLLIEADIEGLIAAGAPTDEYISEAEEIAKIIENNTLELEKMMHNLWQQNFNLSDDEIVLRKDALNQLTNELSNLLGTRETG